MTPTEDDLRAALRDGEGVPFDVNRVLAAGAAKRAHRRTQLVTAAVAGVFVAAAVTTGTVLLTDDDGQPNAHDADRALSPTASERAPAAAAPSASSGSSGSRTAGGAAPPGNAATVPCPASFPRLLTPGGGSPGQFGADGPLFGQPVSTVVVCSYGSDLVSSQGGTPGRRILAGADAASLQASMDGAPKASTRPACPAGKTRNYAFLGVTASGARLPVVTASLAAEPCAAKVTNGTAVRYDWAPPDALRRLLATTTAHGPVASVPNHSPSGKNHGTPVR